MRSRRLSDVAEATYQVVRSNQLLRDNYNPKNGLTSRGQGHSLSDARLGG